MKNYPRLSIEEFGQQLLVSGDLDPIYTGLVKTFRDDKNALKRWLIAYWCFYHAGFASWASEKEGSEFWLALTIAAENTTLDPTGQRWPRGKERRHARGENGLKMIKGLFQKYPDTPEYMVDVIAGSAPAYEAVARKVKSHSGFGDWMSFKVADMLEQVLGVHVDFNEAVLFMFDDPKKAAFMLWRNKQGLPDTVKPKDPDQILKSVVEYLQSVFVHVLAPPNNKRPVGLQEIETILCKWKSHINGHYPLNNDIVEINEGLAPWVNVCKTAEKLFQNMPKVAIYQDVQK